MKYFLLLMLSLSVNNAYSDLYKCVVESGGVQFQDIPCKKTQKEVRLSTSIDSRGLQKKWFKTPSVSGVSAKCTKGKCSCGNESITYHYMFPGQSIQKSVDRLISSWDELKLIRYDKNSKVQSKRIACNIRMNQKIFNINYDVLMKKKKLTYKKKESIDRKEEDEKDLNEECVRNKIELADKKFEDKRREKLASRERYSELMQKLDKEKMQRYNGKEKCYKSKTSNEMLEKAMVDIKSRELEPYLASIERLK